VSSPVWSVDEPSLKAFVEGLRQPPSSIEWFSLRSNIEQLALNPGFERLITLDCNTIKELPHQIDVALRVLRQMGGRAILADEVGLGKTIEAGIILKELMVRGLARRILILTPASLVEQWQGELESKFFEHFDTPDKPNDWHETTRAIASHNRARSGRHKEAILKYSWDVVVVDEAHKVKNHESAGYQFLQQIERNFVLLLTATPLQNDLRELYNLVTLLRPGQLGTWREFQKQHVVRGDSRKAKNPEAIRDLTAKVMVRTRRSSVKGIIDLPPRHVVHPPIELTQPESRLYEETTTMLRSLYREGFIQPSEEEEEEDRVRRIRRTGRGIFGIELYRLLQRLTSSSPALANSLETLASGELVAPEYRVTIRGLRDQAAAVAEHAKLDQLTRFLGSTPDRVIVFSEHLPTLRLIAQRVADLGRPPIHFTGGLSRTERSSQLARFKREPNGVFITSRAGSEGLNLQFCNQLVNYELPWNPMIVEQRIGRVHRIGQTRDVYIINFAASGTIEAHILQLLDQKIKLFQLVIGELDSILGELGGAERLETRLTDAWLKAGSDQQFERDVAEIGEAIMQSREAGKAQETLTSEIAADDNAMRLEREFRILSVAGRVRLGYGTSHLQLARGVEAKRHQLGVHVAEILEALESVANPADAGVHADYGPMQTLTGVTGRGRSIELLVQADRLPMVLIDLIADPEARLV
jgi:SNF2 family DNA or RNA helicase